MEGNYSSKINFVFLNSVLTTIQINLHILIFFSLKAPFMLKIKLSEANFMLALLFACILLVSRAGHIYPQDVIISPNNQGSVSNVTIVFTPETSLLPSDFLRITFPFYINSIQAAYWDAYTNCSTAQPTKSAQVSESTLPDDVDTYFIQLYTDLAQTALSNLTGNVTYYITITGTIQASAGSDMSLPVQMYTVSNNNGNWIVYDSNSVFGLVTLTNAYPSTMIVSLTVPPSQQNSKVLGASYTAYIDISPQVTVANSARVDITLTNPSFSILSCTSVASTAESISSVLAVFTPLASNRIRGFIYQSLSSVNGATYRFSCIVQNPSSPGLTAVRVQSRMGYAETITESGDAPLSLEAALTANSATTVQWDEANNKVELGWGYEGSASNALPIFAVYKDASTAESWYQSVKTTFTPKSVLSMGDKVQVLITTINDSGFVILGATIYHNLPDYSDQEKVICSVITQGYLTCQNVGILNAQSYFVSFRFAVLATTATSSAADFATVQVQTQTASPVTIISLSQTTLTTSDILTNPPLFTSDGTQGIIAYAQAADGTNMDYVNTDENVTLNFRFNYFTNSTIPVTLAELDMGIEFYTSYRLATAPSASCQIVGLVEGQDILTSNCGVQSNPVSGYTKLTFRIANLLKNDTTSPPGLLFQPTPQDGTIAFGSITFDSAYSSSLTYVNENIYDYYARWVQGFTATDPTIITAESSSPFFFNSLVYTAGALADLNVGSTFFVTGQTSGGIGNDGTDFPTLIRITGSLSAAEQVSASRLIVFFNDLEPLNTDTPCFGPDGIVCKYTTNNLDTTQTNSLTDYTGSRRIEINTTLTDGFNIYIPVQTIASKNEIGFFIVTASEFNDSATAQGIYNTGLVKRITSVNYTTPVVAGTTLPIADPSTTTPKITIPNNANAGNIITSSIANIQTAYRVSTPNSGSSIGAAYGYCGNYDFAKRTAFSLAPFYASTETASELCAKVQYSPNVNKTVTCQICPVGSAMTAAVTVTEFTLPTMAGVDFYSLVYVAGTNNGALLAAARDNQVDAMNPFTLANHNITFTPENLAKDDQNVLAIFTFTIVSALPQSIRIILQPSTASGSLMMTPQTGYGCQVDGFSTTSCSINGNDTYIEMDINAASATWPVTTYSVEFMVDSTAQSITADTTISYTADIMVNGINQTLEALHHNSNAQSYVINDANPVNITLTNVTYLFGAQGAITYVFINFSIPNTTRIYSDQDLVFDLGAIANDNVGESPLCVVRDAVTGDASNAFDSCDVSNLNGVVLNSKDSTYGDFVLELGFLQVPTASEPGVSASLISVDGVTSIANIAEIPLPNTTQAPVMSSSSATINRLYSNPGDVADLSITITPSVNALNISSQVYVYFPYYYSEKLGYKNIWCTANDLPVTCSILRSRLLMFTSFTPSISVGSSVTLRIYGILTPVVPVPPSTIFIALDQDADPSTISEYIQVTDQASVAYTANPLSISTFTISTNRIRQQADYTFSLTTDSNGIKANQIISIDFPDRFGPGLQGEEGPIVLISKTGDTVTTQVQTIAFGSRFKIILPLNLDPQTSYTFTIKAIDNPDYLTCQMDRPLLTVTNTAESQVSLRTVPALWNGPYVNYIPDPSQKTLSWEDVNGQPLTELTITVGTFSSEIRIAPPAGEYFNSDISFSTSQNDITLYPPILTAVQGAPYVSLRVGAPIDAVPRTLLVKFIKDESWIADIYSPLPKLQVTLSTQQLVLPIAPLRIMRGGISLPYQWQLDTLNMIPETELQIIAQIADAGSSTLSLVGSSSLEFTPDMPTGGFTFVLSADAVDAPSFTLSLAGTDANSYTLASNQVNVTILDPIDQAPIVNTLSVPNLFAPTRQQVTINLDQMATVYWYVATSLSTTDCSVIESNYKQGVGGDYLSNTQDQYGVFYIFNETQDYVDEIDNLVSGVLYSYVMCFVNQLGYTDSKMGTFQTQDNGAVEYLVTLKFNYPINRDQLASVVCVFNRDLQLPNLK